MERERNRWLQRTGILALGWLHTALSEFEFVEGNEDWTEYEESHFRKKGQSVANFVAELRQLSEHCDFGPVLDDLLRERLVCGINNDAT
ncbi:uncharacterized protein V6R79_008261 [Siganus canaliculatus]